jgi:hypothetical protein
MHSFSRGHHLPLFCRRCAAGTPNKLGQSCRRDHVGFFWNTDFIHIQRGSRVGEESSRCDALLWWELKTCVLKCEYLRVGEVGIIIFAYSTDPNIYREIYKWAHTEDFYIAEDWFEMCDLDLQSPTNPTKLVNQFRLHHL